MATVKLVDFDHVTDYISRDAALACFSDWIDRYGHEHSADEMTEYQRIEELPAADVRPVVRGEWEIDNSYAGPGLMNLRCSVCGEFGGTWRDCTLPSMLYKFCPNCGADMRPDKNDQRGEQQGRENRKTLR